MSRKSKDLNTFVRERAEMAYLRRRGVFAEAGMSSIPKGSWSDAYRKQIKRGGPINYDSKSLFPPSDWRYWSPNVGLEQIIDGIQRPQEAWDGFDGEAGVVAGDFGGFAYIC